MVVPKTKKILALQVAFCVILLSAWEALGRSSDSVFFLVGTPSAVFTEFKQLLLVEDLSYHFLVTSGEAVAGLLIGTLVGAGVGLSLWYSETAAATARPFIIALGTLPIFAFAPLMIVWFGIGFSMKVALATFSTVFVAFNQAYRGATLVSHEYVDVLRGMNASRHQIFLKVIVPGSLDWVLSSMRLNVGFGLLGAFIGEFVASNKGLGYLILRAAGLYNIPRALAAAIGIIVLALVLDFLARYVEKHRYVLVQILSVPRSIWRS
jgi:NitT/TauT family transport system permease protein